MQDIQIIIIGAEIVAGVIITALFVRSRIPKETIEQQGKLIEALTQRQKELLDAHVVNEKAISELQGQIKVYKELPLQEIAASLKMLETLPREFEKISEKSQENIIESFQHLKSQHVDEQFIGGSKTKLKPSAA